MKAGMQTGRRKHLLRGTGLALVLSMLTGLVMPMGGLTGAADVVIEEPVILEAAEPEEAVILVEQEMPDGDGVVEVIPEDPAEAEDEPAPEAQETEDVPEEEIPEDQSADPSADPSDDQSVDESADESADTQDGDSVIEITDEETDEGSAELEEDTGDSVIPVEPETEAGEQTPESQPETVLQADAGGMTVTVAGKLLENVVLTAAMVQEETEIFMPGETLFSDGYGTVIVEEAVAEEDAPVFSVDITLFDENGEVWQPEEAVTVTLDAAALGLRDGQRVQVMHAHVPGDEPVELGIFTVTDGQLAFETNGFSVFTGYTVDFFYGEKEYSIQGGTAITLTDLFAALEIDRNAEDVLDVVFSSPELVAVTYDEWNGDWVLESLQAFDTEETLTVTFADGELVVKVTDAVVFRNTEINKANGTYIETLTQAESGIVFKLFNYVRDNNGALCENINTTGIDSNGKPSYRKAGEAGLFSFRIGSSGKNAYVSEGYLNGYEPKYGVHLTHTQHLNGGTYEKNLWNSFPLIRNVNGTNLDKEYRSLGYLFGGKDHEDGDSRGKTIQVYDNIINTPLRKDTDKGYYYYESKDNAIDFDPESNRVYLRKYLERGKSAADANASNFNTTDYISDFFPFNSVSDKKVENQNSEYTSYDYTNDIIDYWFGASMAADFIQPAGGLVENGDPMIYQFSGDDDVLVYIDGMLVMDLGGPHTRAGGSIDFSTGLVETYLSGDPINGILSHKEFLSKYLDECTETDDGLYTYKSKEVKYYSTTIYECFKFAMEEAGLSVSEIEAKLSEYFVSGGSKITDVAGKEYPVYRLKDNTQHTFDWFYLERYEGQANFNVYFNLLTIPLSTVTVEKQVSGNMGDRNREFDFTIALDKVRDTKGNVPNEVQYVVTDISTGTSTSNTINITKNSNNNDDGGKGEWSGTLKHNQKIQFLNLAIDTTYTIMETEVVGYETTVNGDKKSVVEGSITGGGTSYFLFTNTKEANIDTAAHFDTIPYILTLAFVIPAGVFFFRKRRRTA